MFPFMSLFIGKLSILPEYNNVILFFLESHHEYQVALLQKY